MATSSIGVAIVLPEPGVCHWQLSRESRLQAMLVFAHLVPWQRKSTRAPVWRRRPAHSCLTLIGHWSAAWRALWAHVMIHAGDIVCMSRSGTGTSFATVLSTLP